ncbi:YsnF/AvaK domain-containing protein [Geomonas sp. RF6]|uniref:YsnF/AvaK domain-containing protein n=1 Tax=Geomonas sp. RF6 TaxID=2897342 RepID=UPI001E5045A0|nr:YsnF/AvaK domain-containing protein [Geomonas sp. RF6]UFS69018.1 YsnF/AvaK domain-containing protein [Geomonas sp. RF6]
MAKTVVGLMDSMRQAELVVRDLESSGFDRGSINLVGSHRGGTTGTTGDVHELKDEKKSATAEGAATGAGAGAAVGGLAGFVAGLTALTIPGIGPALALGPLGAALAGAGIGAVAGGGIGALMKMGVPEKDAHYYMEGVKRGGVLVTVTCPEDRVDHAANIMQKHGAIDIDRTAEHWKKEGWTGFQTEGHRDETIHRTGTTRAEGVERTEGIERGREDVRLSERANEEISPRLKQDMADERREGLNISRDTALPERERSDMTGRTGQERTEMTGRTGQERVIPVTEEQVKVGKREVPEGMVRVYSHIESVPIQENVSLREEHAKVERRPVDRPISGSERDAFKEASVEVREMREEPVVSKEARVKEEVLVGKETSQRMETVSETARQTRVDVDRSGEGRQHGMAATGLNAEDEDFRRHYQSMYGGKGDFEAYRSAYHYADEDKEAARFQGRDWSEVEEDLHRSWDRNHPAGSWAQFKEAIRYGWNKKRHI